MDERVLLSIWPGNSDENPLISTGSQPETFEKGIEEV